MIENRLFCTIYCYCKFLQKKLKNICIAKCLFQNENKNPVLINFWFLDSETTFPYLLQILIMTV